MKFAKCLLVALSLWMPAASFAVAAVAALAEHQVPCEAPGPEPSDSGIEENDVFLPSSTAPRQISTSHTVHHESHRPLDGHIAELHSPPPNRA